MEIPKTSSPPGFSPGTLRLLLAVAASAVLMALGWAGLQVRTQQARIRQLEAATAPGDSAETIRRLEHQTADESAKRKLAEETTAAREVELQSIITFLRNELKSANDAIERLKKQAAGN